MATTSITVLLAGASPQRLQRLFSQDAARVCAWVRVMAHDGLAEGQLCYGRMLLEGTGVAEDAAAALRWFRRAAEQGNLEAINMVGRCHDMGWGTDEDPAAAAAQFRQAADAGHAWAQYNLGHLYLDGRGVARDRARAYAYYSRAAALGHVRAMNLVGRCYEEGWGTRQDARLATLWYRRSARGGYFRGAFNYAASLKDRALSRSARRWFMRALETAPEPTRSNMIALLSRQGPPGATDPAHRSETYGVTVAPARAGRTSS
jgi:hypothetical protein